MIRRYAGIVTAALAFVVPLACAAQTIEFDRNGNGIPDIRFGGEDQGDNFMHFDNDEDGTYDFGFLSGGEVHNDGEIYAMWIDKNGDGEVGKKEVKMLPYTLPYATFPTSITFEGAEHPEGVVYFFEYHPGDVVAEVAFDRDRDGDIEQERFRAIGAIGEGAADTLALIDRNNDGYYDRMRFLGGSGELLTETAIAKPLQPHLPVLQMPPLP